jgi:hypothetical protein
MAMAASLAGVPLPQGEARRRGRPRAYNEVFNVSTIEIWGSSQERVFRRAPPHEAQLTLS